MIETTARYRTFQHSADTENGIQRCWAQGVDVVRNNEQYLPDVFETQSNAKSEKKERREREKKNNKYKVVHTSQLDFRAQLHARDGDAQCTESVVLRMADKLPVANGAEPGAGILQVCNEGGVNVLFDINVCEDVGACVDRDDIENEQASGQGRTGQSKESLGAKVTIVFGMENLDPASKTMTLHLNRPKVRRAATGGPEGKAWLDTANDVTIYAEAGPKEQALRAVLQNLQRIHVCYAAEKARIINQPYKSDLDPWFVILKEYADTHKTSEDKTSGDPYASRTAALVDAFLEAENQEARCTLDFCSHSMPWAVRGTLRPWSKQDSDDPYGMRFSCGCRPQHACALRAVVWSRSLVLLM